MASSASPRGADRSRRALASVQAAAQAIDDWLAVADGRDPLDPSAPTILPGWELSVLVAHLAVTIRGTTQTLGSTSRAGLLSVGRYLQAYGPAAQEVSAREQRLAAELGWPGVRAELTAAIAELNAVPSDPLPAKVTGPRGVLRTHDFLGTRMVELAVHAGDLHRSLPGTDPVSFGRAELTLALRTLTRALGDHHPGHTIEVRIPPYAAVQCGIPGDGPTHTRGTPPNVVETDATTFLQLATGRLSWSEAVTEHRVSASGTRADLSRLLPLW